MGKRWARSICYVDQTKHYRQQCFCWGPNSGLRTWIVSRRLFRRSFARFANQLQAECHAYLDDKHLFRYLGCAKHEQQSHGSAKSDIFFFGRRFGNGVYTSVATAELRFRHVFRIPMLRETLRAQVASVTHRLRPLNTCHLHMVCHFPSKVPESSPPARLCIVENSEAVIRMIMKSRSPNLRHMSRTHRVDLDWSFERISLDFVLCIRAIQAHPGAKTQPNFFSQQIFGPGCQKELYQIGFASYESAIKEGRLVPDGFDKQWITSTLVNPLDKKKADNKCKVYDLLNPHHDAIYAVDMEGAQKENFKFYQMVDGCVICFDQGPQEAHPKGYPHQGQGRDLRQDLRRGDTHSRQGCKQQHRDRSQEYLSRKGYRENALCATEVP